MKYSETTSSVLQFNEYLNTSTALSQRMHYFESYRDQLTAAVVQSIKEVHPTTIKIIAAGNMADINYNELVSIENIDKICLTDIDRHSLLEGYAYQSLEGSSIECVYENYLGENSTELIDRYIEAIEAESKRQFPQSPQSPQSLQTVKSTSEKLHSLTELFFKEMEQSIEKSTDSSSYDYILILPIYTQLLFFQIDTRLSYNPLWAELRTIFFSQMTRIIDSFNQKMVSYCNSCGTLFVVSDIVEIDAIMGIRDASDIEKYLATYESNYGLGLGSYGLLNIESYATITKTFYFPWTFDTQRVFLVKACELRNP